MVEVVEEAVEEVKGSGGRAGREGELGQAGVRRRGGMEARQAEGMSDETKGRRELQGRRVGAARQQIDVEDFGMCTKWAEPINPARLDFDPTATLSFDCAQANEQPR